MMMDLLGAMGSVWIFADRRFHDFYIIFIDVNSFYPLPYTCFLDLTYYRRIIEIALTQSQDTPTVNCQGGSRGCHLVAKAGVSWNKNTYLNLIKAVSASGQAWNLRDMATCWD